MKKPIWMAISALIVGIAVGVTTGVHANNHADASIETQLPVAEVRLLSQVLERIKQAYVEEVTDTELIEAAIKGMLTGLDPHSDFIVADDLAEFRESVSGDFGGLGIVISMDETGFVRVVAPIDDTPAYRVGMQSGDLIIQIDDTPVDGMSVDDAVALMRGKPGTSVTLTVLREGQSGPLEVAITRAVIKTSSVRSRMIEPGYGYIRISQFQQRTGPDFEEALVELHAESNESLKGLVVDLRSNPGGVLDAAVEVVDALISEGLIVYTQGRLPNADRRFVAGRGDPSQGVNLVVLIDGGSASASEIVAGAVQDHKRGLIMGTQSFGKGSVQTIVALDQDHALKLTTARYYTPNGRSIQAQGIVPDIEVRRATLTQDENDPFFKEANLSGALDANEQAGDDADSDDEQNTAVPNDDYQLYQAITVLKGLAILHVEN